MSLFSEKVFNDAKIEKIFRGVVVHSTDSFEDAIATIMKICQNSKNL